MARQHAVAVSHVERHRGYVIGPSAVTDEDLELVAHVLGTQIVHLAARQWRPIIGGQTTKPASCERRSICSVCRGHVAPAIINIRAHIALMVGRGSQAAVAHGSPDPRTAPERGLKARSSIGYRVGRGAIPGCRVERSKSTGTMHPGRSSRVVASRAIVDAVVDKASTRGPGLDAETIAITDKAQ